MKSLAAKLLIVFLGALAFPLRGQVLDELGAVIPGAKVALVATDGRRREAGTNAKGEFSIPSVPAGSYILIVEFKGCKPYAENGVKVSPTTEPLKIVLTIAAVNETTEISAEGKGR